MAISTFLLAGISSLIVLTVHVDLSAGTKYHSEVDFDHIDLISFDKDDNHIDNPFSDSEWLRFYNRTKRDLSMIVASEDEDPELGSGSPEPTTTSISTQSSITTNTNTASTNITATTSTLTTQTNSSSTPVTFSSTAITNITSITSTSAPTETQSITTSTTTISITTASTLQYSSSSTTTTTITTTTTSNQPSSSTTSTTSTSISSSLTTIPRTTTLLTTSTSTSTKPSFPCTFNSDCAQVYGGSACLRNTCQCLPPSILYNQLCYPSFPMIFMLRVYIPINMVCEIAFTSPLLYENDFEFVINDIIERSSVLKPIYLTMNIDWIKFLGDIQYIASTSICPPGLYLSSYGEHNRFSRRSVEDKSTVSVQSAYNQFLADCNNTASLAYNVSTCWQQFDVDYTVYFNNTAIEASQPQTIAQRRAYYNSLLLDEILAYRDHNVLLAKLNDSANMDKVYVDVAAVTDSCNAYLSENNLVGSSTALAQCLNGNFDAFLINDTINQAYNQEISMNVTNFPDKCNIYYETCVFNSRLCVDTDFGPVCQCQHGYYSPTGSYNTECIKKCTKNCLNGGRCRIVGSNQEQCFCTDLFFAEYCQINSLIIFIVSAILLFLASLICALLWIFFARRRRKRKEEERRKRPPVKDNDRLWDEILGTNPSGSSNVEAINPAFMANN